MLTELIERLRAMSGGEDCIIRLALVEIEALRKQLATMTKERDKAKAMPMKYRRMEFNAQLQDENDQLRQQLEASQKQVVLLREALLTCSVGDFSTGHVIHPSFDEKLVEEALAATDDLSDVILCHAEPAGTTPFANDPLYRKWEPKEQGK